MPTGFRIMDDERDASAAEAKLDCDHVECQLAGGDALADRDDALQRRRVRIDVRHRSRQVDVSHLALHALDVFRRDAFRRQRHPVGVAGGTSSPRRNDPDEQGDDQDDGDRGRGDGDPWRVVRAGGSGKPLHDQLDHPK